MTRSKVHSSRWALSCLLPALVFFLAPAAEAVMISPVLVELTAKSPVAAVSLHNDSTKAMRFQVETLVWQQVEDQDHYEGTQDLLVVPPIADIAPGASQVFIISWRARGVGAGERAYRLMLEDITQDTSEPTGVLNLRFRHNLPVFAMPAGAARFAPHWRLCAAPVGKGCVRLDNAGNQRIRLYRLSVEGPGWRQEIRGGATVLAGAWTQWTFDLAPHYEGPIRVNAKVEGRVLNAELSAPP